MRVHSLAGCWLLAGLCVAGSADLPRDRMMFGPLVCDSVVLAGIQNRSATNGKCYGRVFCFDLATGGNRWQHTYGWPGKSHHPSDMLETLRAGPNGTVLLTLYGGGAFVIRLRDGSVVRRLAPKPEAEWRALAVTPTRLICGGAEPDGKGSSYPTVVAYDAATMRKLWRYRLGQTDWYAGSLEAEDGEVEVAVFQRQTRPTNPAGCVGPASAIVVDYLRLDGATGRVLGHSAQPTLREYVCSGMTLADGTEVHWGVGETPDGSACVGMREAKSRRLRWRTVFPHLHDRVLCPPFMLVTDGPPRPPIFSSATRSLSCLDAATGATHWQVALEKGPLTPPQPQPLAVARAQDEAQKAVAAYSIRRTGHYRHLSEFAAPARRFAWILVITGTVLALVIMAGCAYLVFRRRR